MAVAIAFASAPAFEAGASLPPMDADAVQQMLWGGRQGVTILDEPRAPATSVSLWTVAEGRAVQAGVGAFTFVDGRLLAEEPLSSSGMSAMATISLVAGLFDSPAVASCPLVAVVVSVTPLTVPAQAWSMLLPFAVTHGVDEAVGFIARGDGFGIGPPRIACLSEWEGAGGYPCCEVLSTYDEELEACLDAKCDELLVCLAQAHARHAMCMVDCLSVGDGLQDVNEPRPVCFIDCAFQAVLELSACWSQVLDNYSACRARALDAAEEALVAAGCWPPPRGIPFP